MITIHDDRFESYRQGMDFIQKYIFPGGMLPSDAMFRQTSAAAGLSLVSASMFGADYARTLSEWEHRFNARLPDVLTQGFDMRFVRMWQFYLAYCQAGFRTGSIDVAHYILGTEAQNSALPG